MSAVAYVLNSHDLSITCTDASTGAALTSGTATWSAASALGTSLGSGSFSHAGSGVYTAAVGYLTFPASVAGQRVVFTIVFSQGDDYSHLRVEVPCNYRVTTLN